MSEITGPAFAIPEGEKPFPHPETKQQLVVSDLETSMELPRASDDRSLVLSNALGVVANVMASCREAVRRVAGHDPDQAAKDLSEQLTPQELRQQADMLEKLSEFAKRIAEEAALSQEIYNAAAIATSVITRDVYFKKDLERHATLKLYGARRTPGGFHLTLATGIVAVAKADALVVQDDGDDSWNSDSMEEVKAVTIVLKQAKVAENEFVITFDSGKLYLLQDGYSIYACQKLAYTKQLKV